MQFRFMSVPFHALPFYRLSMPFDSTASRFEAFPPAALLIAVPEPIVASLSYSDTFSLLCKSFAFRFSTGLCNSSAFRANSLRILRLYILCISYSLQIAATPTQVNSPHFPLGAMQFRFNSLRRFAIPTRCFSAYAIP